MTIELFLTMLLAFSILTSLIVEAVKKVVMDKENLSYNIVAIVSALVIGCVGTAIYYQLTSIPFTSNNCIYIVLMGLASGLVSMVGYDKVKEAIEQLGLK